MIFDLLNVQKIKAVAFKFSDISTVNLDQLSHAIQPSIGTTLTLTKFGILLLVSNTYFVAMTTFSKEESGGDIIYNYTQ